MKRDPRLRGLSSDHHRALVLARRLARAGAAWARDDGLALGAQFDAELEPHFRVEEEVLLPALRSAGASALVERTLADHAAMRASVSVARAGDGAAARALGAQLLAHVRFEERELFPACEAMLGEGILDDVVRRSARG